MRAANIILGTLLLFCCCQPVIAADTAPERLQRQGDGVVLDTETGLMWAARDNGKDVDWWEAKKFCEDYTAGGYDDWRLPDIKELASLFNSGKNNSEGYFLSDEISLSECCMWSSYDTMGGAIIFDFKTGKKPAGYLADKFQLRALPVRGSSKIDLNKFKNFSTEK